AGQRGVEITGELVDVAEAVVRVGERFEPGAVARIAGDQAREEVARRGAGRERRRDVAQPVLYQAQRLLPPGDLVLPGAVARIRRGQAFGDLERGARGLERAREVAGAAQLVGDAGVTDLELALQLRPAWVAPRRLERRRHAGAKRRQRRPEVLGLLLDDAEA